MKDIDVINWIMEKWELANTDSNSPKHILGFNFLHQFLKIKHAFDLYEGGLPPTDLGKKLFKNYLIDDLRIILPEIRLYPVKTERKNQKIEINRDNAIRDGLNEWEREYLEKHFRIEYNFTSKCNNYFLWENSNKGTLADPQEKYRLSDSFRKLKCSALIHVTNNLGIELLDTRETKDWMKIRIKDIIETIVELINYIRPIINKLPSRGSSILPHYIKENLRKGSYGTNIMDECKMQEEYEKIIKEGEEDLKEDLIYFPEGEILNEILCETIEELYNYVPEQTKNKYWLLRFAFLIKNHKEHYHRWFFTVPQRAYFKRNLNENVNLEIYKNAKIFWFKDCGFVDYVIKTGGYHIFYNLHDPNAHKAMGEYKSPTIKDSEKDDEFKKAVEVLEKKFWVDEWEGKTLNFAEFEIYQDEEDRSVVLVYSSSSEGVLLIKELSKISTALSRMKAALREVFRNQWMLAELNKRRLSASIGGVIGRNMAHNIGSHVLHYWEETLEDKDKRMVKYLRNRQSFIAAITTEMIPIFINMRLEEVVSQIPLILAENIAKSEAPNSSFKSQVKIENEQDKKEYIAVPLGTIGIHALFSMLENIIRNCAKHSISKRKESEKAVKINIAIDRNYADDRFHRLIIKENLSESNKCKKLQEIVDREATEFFDDQGNLIKENLGFKEMLVCAAFLRGVNFSEIKTLQSGQIDEPKLLEIQSPDKDTYGLEYIIYLLKPKEILIIDDTLFQLNKKEKLAQHGVDIKSVKWLKQSIKQRTGIWKIYNFVIISDEFPENFINSLPFRKLEKTNEFLNKITEVQVVKINKNFVDNLIKTCWEEWLSKIDPSYSQIKIILLPSNENTEQEFFNEFSNGKVKIIKSSISNNCLKNQISEGRYIIIEHHGENEGREREKLLSKKLVCHDYYGTNLIPFLCEEKVKPEIKIYELIETGLLNTLVIDERLWRKFGSDVRKWILLYKRGITILGTSEHWNNIVEFSNHQFKIANKIKVKIEGKCFCLQIEDYKLLLVHIGMIEKDSQIKKTKGKEKKRKITFLLDAFRTKIRFVIVHSGRGVPFYLPNNAKFVPYEIIEQLIDSSPDTPKFLLKELMKI